MLIRRMISVAAVILTLGPLALAGQQETAPVQITYQDLLGGLKNPTRWLTFSGDYNGQRHSPLKQLTPRNVAGLVPQWIFQTDIPGMPGRGIENTPLMVDGILYVTGNNNQAWAIDGRTGRPIWNYRRRLPANFIASVCCGPVNRGFGILGDRLYMGTLDAHLVALDRMTGKVIWDVPVGDLKKANAITAAPLVVKNLVIIGVAGGDFSSRGYVDAYDAQSGERVWHFNTIPMPGDPGSESWPNADVAARGGGAVWVTGSYDPALNLVYYGTGNPNPDYYGDDREGDNLYTCSLVALDADTGKMRWHYQFTPHDVSDRDATEPAVLVNAAYRGKPRKLLLHADRNGFFYVLDRTSGELLLAKPFLRRVDWATGVGADGRPRVTDPKGCPDDAANWSSAAFSPVTRLFYFLALEECTGSPQGYPDQTGQRFLRALDIETGEDRLGGAAARSGEGEDVDGVLATAGGVVFYGKPNGGFEAVDERDGKTLWRFETNVRMKASPMTFEVGGKQYVAVAAGPNILCFGL